MVVRKDAPLGASKRNNGNNEIDRDFGHVDGTGKMERAISIFL
jgi:hypothetical protein